MDELLDDFVFNDVRGFFESSSTDWCYSSTVPGGYFYYDHEQQAYVFPYEAVAAEAMASRVIDEVYFGLVRDTTTNVLQPFLRDPSEPAEAAAAAAALSAVTTGSQQPPPVARQQDWVWPHQLRLVAEASNKLYVVGPEGASVGSVLAYEPRVYLRGDPDVSEYHANFYYSQEDGAFGVVDRKSTTGTFHKKQAEAAGGSPDGDDARETRTTGPVILSNGDKVRVGSTTWRVHWHPVPENSTGDVAVCNDCRTAVFEPLQTIDRTPSAPQADEEDTTKPSPASLSHREGLYLLKRQLLGEKARSESNSLDYRDRAAERREAVGVEPPPVSKLAIGPAEQATSISTPIADSNKGSQLLRKMGWVPGTGLGAAERSQSSLQVPIQPQVSQGTAGLGSSSGSSSSDPRLALLHHKSKRQRT